MEDNIFSLDELFLCKAYPNYAFKLHKILNAYKSNKEKGIRLSKELIKNKKTLENTIEKFKEKYSNYDEYINDLNDIVNSYDSQEKKVTQYVDNTKLRNDTRKGKNLLQDIYDSGLGLLDYYFYNRVPINFYAYYSNRLCNKDPMALEISLRENKTTPILLDLIKKIDNDELDSVGYYEITKLNPYYLIKIAKDNNMYSKNVSKFIYLLRYSYKINIQSELNNNLVIDSIEVNKETKEQAIEYLQSLDAPINVTNYKSMVRRLIKSSK